VITLSATNEEPSGLAALGWDALVGPGDFYASTDGLVLLHRLFPEKARYLLRRDEGVLHCGLACYLLDDTSAPSRFTRIDEVLAVDPASLRAGATASDYHRLLPTLLCGARQAGPARLLCAANTRTQRYDHALRLLADAEEQGRSFGASSATLLYVDEDDHALRCALVDRGWLALPNASRHVLEIRWHDFEGYLACLSGARRNAVRRERRRLTDAGVTCTVVPLMETDLTELALLERNLKHRYGIPRSADDLQAALERLSRAGGPRAIVVRAHAQETTRGFLVLLRWRDELYARNVGFDYQFQDQTRTALYYEVVFYALAEWASTHGVRQIHYGIESDDAKRSRGCRAIRQTGFVRALTPEAEAIVTTARSRGVLGDLAGQTSTGV
jgi:uncharacterized protein